MTEQDAETLVARLMRVWEPVEELEWEWEVANDRNSVPHFNGFGEWRPGVGFEYFWWEFQNSYGVDVGRHIPFVLEERDSLVVGRLRCFERSGQIESLFPHQLRGFRDYEGLKTLHDEFNAQYLNLFRRNCWLSGFPVEASAHEKLEWVQDFSREEIEAWNLTV